jgi:hypothetical protein
MSRYRPPKIEGGGFFFTLALDDRGGRRDRIIRNASGNERAGTARRGACHRAALCADPLAPLPTLLLLQKAPSKWIKSGLFDRGQRHLF